MDMIEIMFNSGWDCMKTGSCLSGLI